LALVVLSIVEQRLDAVRAVLARSDVMEVAAGVGVHRSTVHRWVGRYLAEQLAGLVDRSHRPRSSPAQVDDAVEVAVAEMRREHPRWGSRRIRLEMLHRPGPWSAGEEVDVPLGADDRPDPAAAGVAAVPAAETAEGVVRAVGTAESAGGEAGHRGR
jgi:transposase